MSDIKILIGTELELDGIRKEIEGLGKQVKPIKIEIDAKGVPKLGKEIDQLDTKVRKIATKKIQVFDEASLKKNQTDFVKIGKSAEDAMRQVEASYKKMNMGDVSLGWEKNAKELDGFTVKVKEAEGYTTSYKYKLNELNDGTMAFVNTGVKGMENYSQAISKAYQENLKLDNTIKDLNPKIEKMSKDFGDLVKPEDTAKIKDMMKALDPSDINFPQKVKEINGEVKNMTAEFTRAKQPIVDMGAALKENLKLDNTIEQTNQKLEAMSRQFGNLVKPEAVKNVQDMMKALDPSEKIFPEKVKEMNIELKRMSDTAKGVLKDQSYMAKQHADALKMNENFNKELEKAKTPRAIDAQRFGGDMQSAGRSVMALAAPVLAVGAASVKMAIDFESSFAGVRKTVSATEEEFQVLSDGIRDMSKRMPQSASEIAGVSEIAGQLNIAKESILDFTEVMVMLGDTTNLASEEAATNLAQFANIVGMSHSDFDRLGATIVDLGNNSATMESNIVSMAMRLAGAGNQIGLSESEILGLSTAMASVGIKAEQGGTAFSRVMVDMGVAATMGSDKVKELEKATGMTRRELELMSVNDTKGFKDLAQGLKMTATEAAKIIKAGKNLEKFGKIAGMSGEQFKKAFEDDAISAIGAFIDGLGTAEEKGSSAIELLEEMGVSSVRLRDALLRTGGANKLFGDTIERGNKAWEENTALTNEAAERYKTAESRLKMLKNTIVDAAIDLGSKLAPSIIEVVESVVNVVDVFSQLPDSVQASIIKVAAFTTVFGGLMSVGGRFISGSGRILTFFTDLGGLLTGTATLTKKTGDVAKKTTGLISGLTGGSGLLVAGVVTALAIAGTEIYKHVKKTKEQKKELDDMLMDAPNVVENHRKDIDSLKDMQKEFGYLNGLVGDNGDLSRMSADEQQRYLDMVLKLKEISPSIETFYDTQGRLIADTRTEIEKLIKAKQDELKIDQEKIKEGAKNRKEEYLANAKERKEKLRLLNEQKADYESISNTGKTLDGKKQSPEQIENSKKALERVREEIQTITKGSSEDIREFMRVVDVELLGVGDKFEVLMPHLDGFKEGIQGILEVDPTNIAGVEKSLDVIERMSKKVQETSKSGLKMDKKEVQGYVSELVSLGTESTQAMSSVYGMMTLVESGEHKFNAISKAVEDYNKNGKITSESAGIIRENFKQVKGSVDKVDLALIKSIGGQDKWAASLLANQTKVKKEVADLSTEYTKQLEKLNPKDVVGTDNITKQIKTAEEAHTGMVQQISKEADEQKQIWEYLYKDLGVISEEQYNQEIKNDKKVTAARIRQAQEVKEAQKSNLMNYGQLIREDLADASKEMERGTATVRQIWDALDPETKEFVAEALNVEDVTKVTDEMFQKWLTTNPEPKKFIAFGEGLDFVQENINELGIDWESLSDEEKVFTATAIGRGLQTIPDFADIWFELNDEEKQFTLKAIMSGVTDAEQFAKDWKALSPEVKQFIAEAVGIKNVKDANEETMNGWAEDPRVKLFAAEHDGLDKVRIEKTETDGVWAITIGDKTYKTNEEGAETARKVIQNLQDKWGKIPWAETKTKTTKHIEEFVTYGATKSAGYSQVTRKNWRGNDNFEGGLSYVGEKGRELLVFPDGSHTMTGNKAELRNLPRGTKIYNNRDTENILSGKKVPEFDRSDKRLKGDSNTPGFASGNVKAKGNPMPANSTSAQAYAKAKAAADANAKKAAKAVKEEYKAVADVYEKVNLQIDKQNYLLSNNTLLQETAQDNTIAKIKLLKQEIELQKQHVNLLNSKQKVQANEREDLAKKLAKSGFKFSGQGDNKQITNLGNINGKSKEVEEMFNRFNELQFTEAPNTKLEILTIQNKITNAISKGVEEQTKLNNKISVNNHLLDMNSIYRERAVGDTKETIKLINEEIKLQAEKERLQQGQADIARAERKELEKLLASEGFKFSGVGDFQVVTNENHVKGKLKEVQEALDKYNNIQLEIIPNIKVDREQIKNDMNKLKSEIISATLDEDDSKVAEFEKRASRSLEEDKIVQRRDDPYWEIKANQGALEATEEKKLYQYSKAQEYVNQAKKLDPVKDREDIKKLNDKADQYFKDSRDAQLEIYELKRTIHAAEMRYIEDELSANIKAQDELRFQMELLLDDDLKGRLELSHKVAEKEIKSHHAIKSNVKALEEQLKVTLYNSDEWHVINDSLQEYNQKLKDSTLEVKKQREELVKIAQEQADLAFEENLLKAETDIFGGKTEKEAKKILDDRMQAQEDFISGEEKVLEIARIKKMIEEDKLAITQEQQDILNEDGEVERAKLDRMVKQLDVQKLQAKLANLQSQKTIRQLTKKDDGTFDFEYVADQKAIKETESAILDSKKDLLDWERSYSSDQERRAFEEKQKRLAAEEELLQEQLKKEKEAIKEHYRTILEMNMELIKQLDDQNFIGGWSGVLKNEKQTVLPQGGLSVSEMQAKSFATLADAMPSILGQLKSLPTLSTPKLQLPKTPSIISGGGDTVQNFNISKVDFPNVTDAKEIENSLRSLSTYANQWANKK